MWETIIGLEVHIELSTETKIFCGCSTRFGAKPNTLCCPVCTGQPGTLPMLNRKVVESAIAASLVLGCHIREVTHMDRKNYFYPDLPKSYQISQLYAPIGYDGFVKASMPENCEFSVRIHELHMEEDAGKLTHSEDGKSSFVDYNRAGVPLLEIVSEPDMRNAEEVIAYLTELRFLLLYAGISNCKMQEGSMRVDVNLSVHQKGTEYGTRTEMKNLSSFRSIRQAIEVETARQISVLSNGATVIQETRRFDETSGRTFGMRSKENADDYRYFPEPDLPPISISKNQIESIREKLPLCRKKRQEMYQAWGLTEYDSIQLTEEKEIADFYEEAVHLGGAAKETANWIVVELKRVRKDGEAILLKPTQLAELVQLVETRKINRTTAKDIFAQMLGTDCMPAQYVIDHGLSIVEDEDSLLETISMVLTLNPQSIADYKAGKDRAIGFLIGQCMKQLGGKGDAKKLREMLLEKIRNGTI